MALLAEGSSRAIQKRAKLAAEFSLVRVECVVGRAPTMLALYATRSTFILRADGSPSISWHFR
eukprot:scaffold137154_cov136-Phaeocystis_antarctica.AAC.1